MVIRIPVTDGWIHLSASLPFETSKTDPSVIKLGIHDSTSYKYFSWSYVTTDPLSVWFGIPFWSEVWILLFLQQSLNCAVHAFWQGGGGFCCSLLCCHMGSFYVIESSVLGEKEQSGGYSVFAEEFLDWRTWCRNHEVANDSSEMMHAPLPGAWDEDKSLQ